MESPPILSFAWLMILRQLLDRLSAYARGSRVLHHIPSWSFTWIPICLSTWQTWSLGSYSSTNHPPPPSQTLTTSGYLDSVSSLINTVLLPPLLLHHCPVFHDFVFRWLCFSTLTEFILNGSLWTLSLQLVQLLWLSNPSLFFLLWIHASSHATQVGQERNSKAELYLLRAESLTSSWRALRICSFPINRKYQTNFKNLFDLLNIYRQSKTKYSLHLAFKQRMPTLHRKSIFSDLNDASTFLTFTVRVKSINFWVMVSDTV